MSSIVSSPCEQMQLFDSGMAMRRIVGSRREPHEHADAVFLRIRGEEFAGDARRHLFPFRFQPVGEALISRRLARLRRDSLGKAFP